MTRRSPRPRAYAPDPDAPGQICDMPGCAEAAGYRAPKSRGSLREYHWFCLDHVRAYNAAWDYYKGMTPGEIEAELRRDTSWQRPSWPLGRLGALNFEPANMADPLGVLGARAAAAGFEGGAPPDLRQPLATLGLGWPVSFAEVKARYKRLAKQHHPDANHGDPAAEERLKTINVAYAAIKTRLETRRPAAP